ncbi:hypothetical protein [Vaginisenegalia massiliensis]|uniref:hypothetical protein n=1 Tax=Vaginisenegalia massiliensis TaxID=2058294 RepID=UPI000F52ABBE|nr:hypothetical protein [Vaginisenegalia massiliensis]
MEQASFNKLLIGSALTIAGVALYVHCDGNARNKVQGLVNRERAKALVQHKLKADDDIVEAVDDLSDNEVSLLMKFIDGSNRVMDKASEFLDDVTDRVEDFRDDASQKAQSFMKDTEKEVTKKQDKVAKKAANLKDDLVDKSEDVIETAHDSYLETIESALKIGNMIVGKLNSFLS